MRSDESLRWIIENNRRYSVAEKMPSLENTRSRYSDSSAAGFG